jgi:hypothetical protein
MGSPSPPQAPIFFAFFARIFYLSSWEFGERGVDPELTRVVPARVCLRDACRSCLPPRPIYYHEHYHFCALWRENS